jgi:hypothetical protein
VSFRKLLEKHCFHAQVPRNGKTGKWPHLSGDPTSKAQLPSCPSTGGGYKGFRMKPYAKAWLGSARPLFGF